MKRKLLILLLLSITACTSQQIHLDSVSFHDPSPQERSFGSGSVGLGYNSQTEYTIVSDDPSKKPPIKSCISESCSINAPFSSILRITLYDRIQLFSAGNITGIQYQLLGMKIPTKISFRLGAGQITQASNLTINSTQIDIKSKSNLTEVGIAYGYEFAQDHIPYFALDYIYISTDATVDVSGSEMKASGYGGSWRLGPGYRYKFSDSLYTLLEVNLNHNYMTASEKKNHLGAGLLIGFKW